MRVSLVCTTGSTELNSRLRAELLWRMVNSAHIEPGHPFELILVDNSQGGAHREAIRDIFDTYNSVTHIVQNKINEFHGGGVRQGMAVADGDILVQVTDDLEWKPGWLADLIAPLLDQGRPISIDSTKRGWLIAAPIKGHNVNSHFIRGMNVSSRQYQVRTNAAAYCWAFWRETWNFLGPWKRAHFADTRWSVRARRAGYKFVLPTWEIAKETNLNYLRPWDYKNERGRYAQSLKYAHIDTTWSGSVLAWGRIPERPTVKHPLRNPKDIGPGAYPAEWLRDQEIAGDA